MSHGDEDSADDWGDKDDGCGVLPDLYPEDEAVPGADELRDHAPQSVSLQQQVEQQLDEMDSYERDSLLKLCHTYIFKRPASQQMVEYANMCSSDREVYLVLDTQNSVLFWQGSATHHLRKLHVRAPTQCPLPRIVTWIVCLPPRAII